MLFTLSNAPLDAAALGELLRDDAAGACATFEGRVRNHNEGRSVERLEYEAWDKLALREGAGIVAEAIERFSLERAFCVHRTGSLEIGECAVWVGASAAHRDEAFAACRTIIDRVKAEVPIWKKEHYSDGAAEWVNCHRCAAKGESTRYARQLCLPEVGEAGQQKLSVSRVLVVGAGGLGSPALLYLAAAGVGHITVCDGDVLDLSNLHRQVLFDAHGIGHNKARLAQQRLRALNSSIEISSIDKPLTHGEIESVFAAHDLVLDCTDNFATRFLLNDAAVLTGTPLISAGIHQYEGQVQLYDPASDSACLRCVWREPPQAVGDCATAGVLGPVAGVFGALQATEALKFLLGIPETLAGRMLLMDLRSHSMRLVTTTRDSDCPVCTRSVSLDRLHGDNASAIEMDLSALSDDEQTGFTLVDIRDEAEAGAPLPGVDCLRIPAMRLLDDPDLMSKDRRYLLCCGIGFRSRNVAGLLRQRGYDNVFSQAGGLNRLVGGQA